MYNPHFRNGIHSEAVITNVTANTNTDMVSSQLASRNRAFAFIIYKSDIIAAADYNPINTNVVSIGFIQNMNVQWGTTNKIYLTNTTATQSTTNPTASSAGLTANYNTADTAVWGTTERKFDLATPFVWDTTSNIRVLIELKSASSATNPGGFTTATATQTNSWCVVEATSAFPNVGNATLSGNNKPYVRLYFGYK